MPTGFNSLQQWLDWQETLHPKAIELGLERVSRVHQHLHSGPPAFTVITVAGTNGKGSSVRMLESILLADGYQVAAYTSPHLHRYNERIRLNGEDASDAAIVAAFQRIDEARADVSLTYFEFGTLAALDIFWRASPDVVLLEVGLGGRLDAVNIIDPDVALITSVDVDHTAWLGTDRETIAAEKAGILRAGKAAVCSDPDTPLALLDKARQLEAPLHRLGVEYDHAIAEKDWCWRGAENVQLVLPHPLMPGRHQFDNAAGVMMVLHLLRKDLPVSRQALREGLLSAVVPGRCQIVEGPVSWIYDVAHNPDSVGQLSKLLAKHPHPGRTHALLGMMADKDLSEVVAGIMAQIDVWHVTGLQTPRAASAADLTTALQGAGIGNDRIQQHAHTREALAAIKRQIHSGDRVVVFGSFYTVAEILQQ